MIEQKFTDDEIYPIEASERGTNAYYVAGCEVVGHQAAYCACLKKVRDQTAGNLNPMFSDCGNAISRRECKAQKMRSQEIDEGKAVFFINRVKLNSYSQIAESVSVERFAMPSKPASRIAKPIPVTPRLGSYADAINAAIAEQNSAEPAVAPTLRKATPAIEAKPGMSLIELARLQLASQSQI